MFIALQILLLLSWCHKIHSIVIFVTSRVSLMSTASLLIGSAYGAGPLQSVTAGMSNWRHWLVQCTVHYWKYRNHTLGYPATSYIQIVYSYIRARPFNRVPDISWHREIGLHTKSEMGLKTANSKSHQKQLAKTVNTFIQIQSLTWTAQLAFRRRSQLCPLSLGSFPRRYPDWDTPGQVYAADRLPVWWRDELQG